MERKPPATPSPPRPRQAQGAAEADTELLRRLREADAATLLTLVRERIEDLPAAAVRLCSKGRGCSWVIRTRGALASSGRL